jgi:cysteinyl-tRNA synthetase
MLRLTNSMTKKEEEVRPRHKDGVRIFTCGPSIYQRPHIGNYRTFLYEDLVVRYLEYKGHKVKRIINFTDVEDKSISAAHARHKKTLELTEDISHYFFKETEQLSIKLPRIVPRSSTTVQEAAEITRRLVKKGYAYWHDGNAYFDPLKFKGFGKLYGLSTRGWPKKHVRFSKDTYEGRRWNRGDFILWHGNKAGEEPWWDTVIGRGRPSWNIQDPAIIIKHLGDSVDINCGGIDNIFRHHDYNIAVMESYTGKTYAGIYLHGEHLIVDGKKMSKSKGNVLYPEHVLKKGYSPAHLRFFLTGTYYRKKLNFTWDRFARQAARLDAFHKAVGGLLAATGVGSSRDALALIAGLRGDFEAAMDHDLRLGVAFAGLEAAVKRLARIRDAGGFGRDAAARLRRELERLDAVAQFLLPAGKPRGARGAQPRATSRGARS